MGDIMCAAFGKVSIVCLLVQLRYIITATSYIHMSITSVQLLIRVRPFATPWTAARQASLSITNSMDMS